MRSPQCWRGRVAAFRQPCGAVFFGTRRCEIFSRREGSITVKLRQALLTTPRVSNATPIDRSSIPEFQNNSAAQQRETDGR